MSLNNNRQYIARRLLRRPRINAALRRINNRKIPRDIQQRINSTYPDHNHQSSPPHALPKRHPTTNIRRSLHNHLTKLTHLNRDQAQARRMNLSNLTHVQARQRPTLFTTLTTGRRQPNIRVRHVKNRYRHLTSPHPTTMRRLRRNAVTRARSHIKIAKLSRNRNIDRQRHFKRSRQGQKQKRVLNKISRRRPFNPRMFRRAPGATRRTPSQNHARILFAQNPYRRLSRFHDHSINRIPSPGLTRPSLRPTRITPMNNGHIKQRALFSSRILRMNLSTKVYKSNRPCTEARSDSALSVPGTSTATL